MGGQERVKETIPTTYGSKAFVFLDLFKDRPKPPRNRWVIEVLIRANYQNI